VLEDKVYVNCPHTAKELKKWRGHFKHFPRRASLSITKYKYMWSCINGHIVPDVLKDCSAFEMLELQTQHSVTCQRIWIFSSTTVGTWNLTRWTSFRTSLWFQG
jgi:predicted transcriptional regulator